MTSHKGASRPLHTPGPWEVREKSTGVNSGLMIYEDKSLEESHPIAISLGYASPECKANAQLIAAAPELLAELKAIVHKANELNHEDATREELAELITELTYSAALAKATGNGEADK